MRGREGQRKITASALQITAAWEGIRKGCRCASCLQRRRGPYRSSLAGRLLPANISSAPARPDLLTRACERPVPAIRPAAELQRIASSTSRPLARAGL